MRRVAIFLVLLTGGMGILTVGAYLTVTSTTRKWFEKDLALRARLATTAARQSILQNWKSPQLLTLVLDDITHDERIMGAAACSSEGYKLAATENFPLEFSCSSVAEQLRATGEARSEVTELPSGPVQLSITPVTAQEDNGRGAVLLVHDLSYVNRRDATTKVFLLFSFFVLSLTAALVTIVALRLVWKRWTLALQRSLIGNPEREFQPLVKDVRDLVNTLVHETHRDAVGGVWGPDRLKATLNRNLQGERVVILANREPYIHERQGESIRVLHPASGLVSALEPVMRACSGVWVAHGSGSADRETVDKDDRVKVPPGEESYSVRRVWLTEAEENGYYYGFSNEGLWPLCHVAHTRPIFRSEDWECYVQVNQKFADAVCSEVLVDDPIVLVQDYHFALAPQMIRQRLPMATIITFWHIPWPNAERIGICPWHDELIAGLLGSSIVGFHTQQHCNNFIDSVDAYMESRIDREHNAVVQGHRKTLVRPYPISIEWPVRWLNQIDSIPTCRRDVRQELGLGDEVRLGVGIDRLDYTKGIEERLLAVDELLTRYPEFRGKFSFAQLAAPSRTKIPHYLELNTRVEELAQTINKKWGDGDYRPIILLRAHHEPATVFRYYRAAELCYVSSLHDGMNLVAKEYVAAREDNLGVLILSQFTGAARDLTEALIVNPYDIRQAGDALAAALHMPQFEQQERMRAMRKMVSEFNVYRWAGKMLVDAAELRRKERASERYSSSGGKRRFATV